jgi:hypothetical protein
MVPYMPVDFHKGSCTRNSVHLQMQKRADRYFGLRHLLSNRSKGFELAGIEKISANSKAFGAERLRTYEFSLKLKALLKKL